MKKLIAFLICLVICLGAVACGNGGNSKSKSAFDSAKEAYANIDSAYALIDTYASDIYEAWRVGIYDSDNISISHLASEISISEDDLQKAAKSISKEALGDEQYVDVLFAMTESKFSLCVELVSEAYKLNGTTEEIDGYMSNAKGLMKEMSEKYSDYEHYSNLKGYYTTVISLSDFCNDPSGSFEQVKDTINDYRNDIRDFKNDLSYIFED